MQHALRDDHERLAALDKKFVWHPFTQMQDWEREDILIIRRARGMMLEDTLGRKYLDGVSSLWCNVHGHGVPEIDEALRDQLGQVAHSTFLGLSNVPAIELAEQLIEIAPRGLKRVFYSDSGSAAVEVGLKMAYQYWQQSGRPEKKKFLRLTNAYHGDTLGSVSVGGIQLFHDIFRPLLFETFSAPSPYVYRWPGGGNAREVCEAALGRLEHVLSENHEKIAAFVMEPVMQGAAGMLLQPEGYISRARELTKRYNVLLIFDEVATGFGRTGKMFASEWEQVTPDIMAVAKGLTAGYLPLSATLTTEEIYRAFHADYSELKAFFHGHTFTANPMACRAGLASLELFQKNRVLEGVAEKSVLLSRLLDEFRALEAVGDIRQSGFMVGIELVRNRETRESWPIERKIGIRVIQRAREKGAIIRPLGPVIVLMPPPAMSAAELEQLLDITYASIQEETGRNA